MGISDLEKCLRMNIPQSILLDHSRCHRKQEILQGQSVIPLRQLRINVEENLFLRMESEYSVLMLSPSHFSLSNFTSSPFLTWMVTLVEFMGVSDIYLHLSSERSQFAQSLTLIVPDNQRNNQQTYNSTFKHATMITLW